jgi:glycosyltransferase involved in cell wall biosynthesis
MAPAGTLRILNVACVRWWSALAHYAHSAALALHKRGHRVLAAGSSESPYIERCRESGIPVAHDIDPTRRGPSSMLRTLRRVRQVIASGEINVLLVHSGAGHGEAALARQGVRTPHVLIRARPEARPPRPYPWNLWVHGMATDRFLLSGTFMRSKHYGRWPVPSERMAVVRGAVDTEAFSRDRWAGAARSARERLGIPREARVVGVIGRLSPVKGHRVALEGLLPLLAVDPRLHLLVMGEEAQLRWADLAREIPEASRPRVHYTGRVEEIAGYAAACDVGLIPSTGSEAVCRVAMEWMSLGVPVVGTSVHVIPEIVRDGETGWIIPPNDPRSLRRTMEAVLSDSDEARARGESGRAVAREEFSLDSLGRHLEDLIIRALRGEPWS